MPLERVSRSFKDISLSLVTNPATSDVTVLTNERAIARSVRNLITTARGERFFQPTVGSDVASLLFENMLDLNIVNVLQEEIRNTLNTYEPRVDLKNVILNPLDDTNTIEVTLIYDIVGLDLPTQQLDFVLQPTR